LRFSNCSFKHSRHSERVVSTAATLGRARRIASSLGVTRLAEITGLDRIGIPVHTAVVPKSDDLISVYNGKGVLPEDSQAGALMEAIERQTVLGSRLPMKEASYRSLSRGSIAVASPASFNQALNPEWDDDSPCSWLQGHDLFSGEPIYVPAGLAGYGPYYTGPQCPYEFNSTNGLASGNCLEEAICHALCELVERDSWTLAELRNKWIPWAQRQALFGTAAGPSGWDDVTSSPRIDLSSAGPPIPELLAKCHKAGLSPVVRDITGPIGLATVIAAVADDCVPDFPQCHLGLGTHPDSRIAVIRALTELAQSRLVDIQAVREDMIPSTAQTGPENRLVQRIGRIEPRRWFIQDSGPLRPFSDIPSVENEDIAADIRLILDRLAGDGIERAIVVDFSEPDGFSVVRVIVPGLEFWSADHGKIGPRALNFWRRHAAL
jgi:ribosomal protein S12 methylthiotransferase accessory factor